ncbi:MAG: DUF86 domain-containing protein [Nanoarchaeota archaeon]|nr:DUF86 domain-containing protein [Nanoarchaeota archaeon]MBU1644045.1 DUF86 domain-containing protein [Nanoarchaeota archaeon]MBU1977287.1 DUF86 domain-containing protein [Nanoarchaeota archaeon]
MIKDPLVFIKHINDAIILIEKSTLDLNKKEFNENRDIQDATIRRLEIIGEAVKNIPKSFRNKHPRVPWKKIAGTRDKLIHLYAKNSQKTIDFSQWMNGTDNGYFCILKMRSLETVFFQTPFFRAG